MIDKRFISVAEAANYLGVSVSAVRKWQRLGQIPFCRLNGSIRFDLHKLDSWAHMKV